MGLFGWSYPPGAANDPFAPYNQEEGPCDVCMFPIDDCICPVCPVCDTGGDAACYKDHPDHKQLMRPYNGHGLKRSAAQKEHYDKVMAECREQNRIENEAEARMFAEMEATEGYGDQNW